MLLQRFEFVDFANYQLEIRQAATIKPANFTSVKRSRRADHEPLRSAPSRRSDPPSRPRYTLDPASTTARMRLRRGTPSAPLHGVVRLQSGSRRTSPTARR